MLSVLIFVSVAIALGGLILLFNATREQDVPRRRPTAANHTGGAAGMIYGGGESGCDSSGDSGGCDGGGGDGGGGGGD